MNHFQHSYKTMWSQFKCCGITPYHCRDTCLVCYGKNGSKVSATYKYIPMFGLTNRKAETGFTLPDSKTSLIATSHSYQEQKSFSTPFLWYYNTTYACTDITYEYLYTQKQIWLQTQTDACPYRQIVLPSVILAKCRQPLLKAAYAQLGPRHDLFQPPFCSLSLFFG